ncbi:MAG: hypothetical protein D6681_17755 [Calditrichaeota bacterium]|nr:MAG: hypothetical protein D6681_17755 [Calditrichota bacterium]
MKRYLGYMFWLALWGIVLTALNCSPETRYRVLSTVFDGVPAPESLTAPPDTATVSTTRPTPEVAPVPSHEPTLFLHDPYAERSCEDCHNEQEGNKLFAAMPDLCYDCHDDFSEEYKYVHGPVASGYCTQCHNPHKAPYEKLLIRSTEELCFYCHEQADVYKNEEHEDVEPSECLDCHNPHGGDEWNLTE